MKHFHNKLQELGSENENLVESQQQLQRKLKVNEERLESLKLENQSLKDKVAQMLDKEKKSHDEIF